MNQNNTVAPGRGGRLEWAGYGFLAGVVCGVLMGWFFAGFVVAFMRVAMVALIVVPIILLYLGWRKFVVPILRPPAEVRYIGAPTAIETTAVIHDAVSEPLPR